MAAEEIASVYAVFADAAEAARIGRAVVERRLAACVNIIGTVQSTYWWDGRIEETSECAALFKTTRAGASDLIAAIAAAHSYDTPAIVAWPATAAHGAFVRWTMDEVR